MIIIAGTISIPADKRAACIEATTALQQATRDDEPGCLAYNFAADACRPDIIAVYELWTDADSLNAHFQHSNYTDMRNLLGSLGITGADVQKFKIEAAAPVYGADGIASADSW
jgi:quinol monooxygenase YgiN